MVIRQLAPPAAVAVCAAAGALALGLTGCTGSGSGPAVGQSSSAVGGAATPTTNPDPGFAFVYDTVNGSYTDGKEWISRAGISRQIPGHGYNLNNAVPSADGTHLLVMRARPTDAKSHVVVMGPSGVVERVVPHTGGCFPGGFAGTRIVVTCGDPTWQVLAIDPSGATKALGPDNPGASAAVSPDGRTVLAAKDDTLYTVPITGGRRTVLVAGGASGDTGAWTGDGKHIAYLAGPGGSDQTVYLMNADGTGKHKVAGVPIVGDLHVTISRDGAHILVSGSADAAAQFWTVDADGSDPHYLSGSLEGGDPHPL